ncbi:uncharacterized protein BDZ99DRAFT_192022 [Mytilinidion resinicola]|uniref:Uncharacterized protein n=1 Tax=Mytilinidion resinicola TaxID=574789 RepID=A0A6A6Z4L8_9PEZI|nr:uncharacterized protein BDZ99DRAFT_192022 [Mytilinidion resinicola]KAF2815197.1 hypothetical protein BDZ99DRAFT_192022 [Mytilinidion resinicola]
MLCPRLQGFEFLDFVLGTLLDGVGSVFYPETGEPKIGWLPILVFRERQGAGDAGASVRFDDCGVRGKRVSWLFQSCRCRRRWIPRGDGLEEALDAGRRAANRFLMKRKCAAGLGGLSVMKFRQTSPENVVWHSTRIECGCLETGWARHREASWQVVPSSSCPVPWFIHHFLCLSPPLTRTQETTVFARLLRPKSSPFRLFSTLSPPGEIPFAQPNSGN